MFQQVEEQVQSGVEWLRLLVETLGALVIAAGIAVAVAGIVRLQWLVLWMLRRAETR